MIYTIDGAFRTSSTITTLEKEYPTVFMRCHKCYLVNPHHIIGIRRFKVTMSIGNELPIPKKKYTNFRNKVNDILSKNCISLML
ncbi:MAG: LytTR family transcriptional regulator [Lachnospiraceae bacterium]|nr:LytTR family transcriptional regulator [Lachnospiraceae bacterium]